VRLLHERQSKKKPKNKPAPGDSSADRQAAELTAKYVSNDRLTHRSPGEELSNCSIPEDFSIPLDALSDFVTEETLQTAIFKPLVGSTAGEDGIPSFHPSLCIMSLLVGFSPSLRPSLLSFDPSHSSPKLASYVKGSSPGFSKSRLRLALINLDVEQASRP
jgi:hypothetical protein